MKWGAVAVAALLFPSFAIAATISAPSCAISTPPGTYYPGSVVRLIWYTENTSHAFLNNGIGEVPLQGYQDVYPNQSVTYVMTVNSPAGTKTCTTQVKVTAQPTVLYQPTALPVNFFPAQVYWAPARAPYVSNYYDDGYDWYINSPYMYSGTPYVYTVSPAAVYTQASPVYYDTWPTQANFGPQNPGPVWIPDTPESVASPDSPLFDPPFGPPKPGVDTFFTSAVNDFPTALQPDTYVWNADPTPAFTPGVQVYSTYSPDDVYQPAVTQTVYYDPNQDTYNGW